tara:strand:+ start:168 stop:1121 length:954 start_codon:yes stop_codon:yes gene_type:complete
MTQTVYVAGHNGMVGSAIIRRLKRDETNTIITANRSELDLTNQQAVKRFFAENNIDQVYLAAAKVGGIHANNEYPAEFIYKNLMIESNIIHEAWQTGVQKLLFLGSSCIYPRLASQPMSEDALLTGLLEPTNEPYAIAKIAGIKLCESYNRQYGTDYRSVMPSNLYGPGDNYHSENSHVIPALIRKFHQATRDKSDKVVIWGTGTPRREFLYVDDMAEASVHVMELNRSKYDANTELMQSHINLGSGIDITIRELADAIARVAGYVGRIEYDAAKPDGPPRKLLDISRLHKLGWHARTSLEQGLSWSYSAFNQSHGK